LFIIIESLILAWFLIIWKNWAFIWEWLEKNVFYYSKTNLIYDTPKSDYNQFPCTIDSRLKRVKMFYDKFPYIESMTIWIFWDDDLLSIELWKTEIFIPIVFEIDENIIAKIKEESNNEIKIIKWNILDKNFILCEKVDTFISDPPYNYNWLVNFINFWIKQLNNNTNEFFIIFNKMMLWNDYFSFINALNKKWVFLLDIIKSFSLYNFPLYYRELVDINKKLKKYNYQFNDKNISSSSSLFHFKIWGKEKKNLDFSIYKRY
jgi:predicted methyltransferase